MFIVRPSSRSDQQKFYQLLSHNEDVDLAAKLEEWVRLYNLAKPHSAHNGKTPYDALRAKPGSKLIVSRQLATVIVLSH